MPVKLKKRTTAVITLLIALILVLVGTFAWYSFNQSRVNVFNESVSAPGVNLHDDFAGGPEKDVYVENTGLLPVLVRVRLAELININGNLNPENAVDDGDAYNWHIHIPHDACEICDFQAHQYFTWVMDGQKFYMPAHPSARGGGDVEPLPVGDKEVIIDYAKLLAGTFTEIYASEQSKLDDILECIDDYLGGDYTNAELLLEAIAEIPDSYVVNNVVQYEGQSDREHIRKLNEVRLTLIPDTIITMPDWIKGAGDREPYATGDFWVIDSDGWCYWASPLQPDTATGQLLSSVTYQDNYSNGEMTYKINVHLNATTIDRESLDRFFFVATQSGGITEQAKLLAHIAAGDAVISADGAFYGDNGDGSFLETADKDGNPVTDAKAFIPLGTEAANGSAYDKVNTTDEYRLYVGDTLDIADLRWDGTVFAAFDEYPDTTAPMYNLTKHEDESGMYTVVGSEIGADGKVYIRLADSEGALAYITSVQRTGFAPMSAFGPEIEAPADVEHPDDSEAPIVVGTALISSFSEEGGDPEDPDNPLEPQTPVEPEIPDAKWPDNYIRVYPGEGPFSIIVSSGIIGADDNAPAKHTARYFHHVGSGVYVEVADTGGTESIHAPTTYFFAGQIMNGDPYIISSADSQDDIDAVADLIFPLKLTVGDGFDLDFGEDGSVKGILADGTMYTMQEIVANEDGKAYVPLGDDLFIGPGADGAIGGSDGVSLTENDGSGFKVIEIFKPSGNGSLQNPYQIKSRLDMNWLSARAFTSGIPVGEYYEVGTNFSMGEVPFIPVGSDTKQFAGHFDGKNYTISGLVVGDPINNSNPIDYRGLFGCIGTGGTVENVVLDNANVNGNQYVGGVAGQNGGTIANCRVLNGLVKGSGGNIGGVVGNNSGFVQSSYNTGSIEGANFTGGVAGRNTGANATVQTSYNSGPVSGASYVGGVVGYSTGVSGSPTKVTVCFNTGTVEASGNSIGGVAGYNGTYSEISDCYNMGDVTGGLNSNSVGGMVGTNTGAGAVLKVGYNMGDVAGYNQVGGLVGENTSNALLQNCNAWCDVTGNQYVGGVVGYVYNGAKVYNTYHTAWVNDKGVQKGKITGGTSVGGIVGYLGIAASEVKYNVAIAYSINGIDTTYTNKVIGSRSNGVNSDNYSSNSIQGISGSGGHHGIGADLGEQAGQINTYDWWKNTVKGNNNDFANTDIWIWADVYKLPIMMQAPGGDGTAAKPYEVKSREDLEWLAASVAEGLDFSGKVFKLANDIDMGGVAFTPIGDFTTSKPFRGTLDGNGYEIQNLVVNRPGMTYNGLFGYIGIAGVVKNVALTDVDITGGGNNTGAIAGYSIGTIEKSCVFGGTVAGSNYTGGIVGNNLGLVKNCYVRATVDGNNHFGGIVGYNNGGTVNTVYHSGNELVVVRTNTNGGKIEYAVPSAETSKANIDEWRNLGGDFASASIWGWDGSLPILIIQRGDAASPFIIAGRADMDKLSADVAAGNAYEGYHFKVVNNFSMGAAAFTPIGTTANPFRGNFDSDGHVIRNLKVDASGNYAGLFGCVGDKGAVQNVELAQVDIRGVGYLGGIAGNNNGGVVTACTVSGAVIGTGDSVGGIVGRNIGGTINDCENSATVSGKVNIGGIAGIGGNLSGCTNTGAVTGTNTFIGGITGNNNATIENCHNTGNVNASGSTTTEVGGIVGISGSSGVGGEVIGCTNSGKIFGAGNIGGIVGRIYNDISNVKDCGNTGNVTATGNNVAGIVGQNTGGTVQTSRNTGSISSTGQSVGGIAGLNSGTVEKCYSDVSEPGEEVYSSIGYAGGIVGYNRKTVTNCYALGNVRTGGTCAGGIVGMSDQTNFVSYVYHAKGSVTASTGGGYNYAGGIIGSHSGTGLSYCAAMATSVKGTYANKIAGASSAPALYCYVLNEMTLTTGNTTGVSGNDLSKALAEAEGFWRKTGTHESYGIGGDFADTSVWRWDSESNLPVLQGVTP